MEEEARPQGPSPADLLALQGRAITITRRVIDGITPEQMGAATPCTEWDVRAVINHLVVGNKMVSAMAAGDTPPDRNAVLVGADPKADFATSAREADAAFRAEGVMGRTFRLPFGEVPGPMMAGMRFVDTLVHAWDLAKATGQSTTLDPELCQTALDLARMRMGSGPRQAGAPIGPEVETSAEAPVCDRFAAYMGRQP